MRIDSRTAVLVIDDDPVARLGFVALLSGGTAFDSIHEASGFAAATKILASIPIAVVICDLDMDDCGGVRVAAQLKSIQPTTKVLIVSNLSEAVFGERAVRAGADGYLARSIACEKLNFALERTLQNGVFLSDSLQSQLVSRYRVTGTPREGQDALTDRELEVFMLIGRGKPSKEIAHALGRSLRTIEAHRASIKQKLGLRTGAEVGMAALGFVRAQKNSSADRVKPEAAPELAREEA
jgi:two-component system, NarL family, response regulator NreC